MKTEPQKLAEKALEQCDGDFGLALKALRRRRSQTDKQDIANYNLVATAVNELLDYRLVQRRR